MKNLFLKPLNLMSIIIMMSILMACLKKEEVVPMPVAYFEEEVFANFTVPTTITFYSLSENADSYFWTYPGGTSTDEDLTLNFRSAGTYPITLKVTNKAGSDTYSQTYFLVAPASSTTPTASFTYSPNSNLVAPAKITFTNSSKNADTYKWDFGDGTTSTAVSPVKEFTKAGDYNVKLTATDAKNQTNQVISTVSVKSAPVINNDGTYTFFIKSDLKVGNIDVTVNNVLRGTISQYHINGVTCGQGNVNVALPAGNYAFSAKAGDGTTWSDNITFEKGACKAYELTKSTTPVVNNDGTYTFFIKSDLKVGNIDVTVNNVLRGTISQYHSNGVTCGQGNVNVALPAGTYAFSAKASDGTVWSDKITFEKGICKTQELTKNTNSGGGTTGGTNCDWSTYSTSTALGIETKWGTCGADGLSIKITNKTSIKLETHFCIEEKSGRWDCGAGSISAGSYTTYWSCGNTGRTKVWAMSKDEFNKNNCSYPKP
jgi:PKD repeat protein